MNLSKSLDGCYRFFSSRRRRRLSIVIETMGMIRCAETRRLYIVFWYARIYTYSRIIYGGNISWKTNLGLAIRPKAFSGSSAIASARTIAEQVFRDGNLSSYGGRPLTIVELRGATYWFRETRPNAESVDSCSRAHKPQQRKWHRHRCYRTPQRGSRSRSNVPVRVRVRVRVWMHNNVHTTYIGTGTIPRNRVSRSTYARDSREARPETRMWSNNITFSYVANAFARFRRLHTAAAAPCHWSTINDIAISIFIIPTYPSRERLDVVWRVLRPVLCDALAFPFVRLSVNNDKSVPERSEI